MSIPVLCHAFLILFGGFFAIQLAFNSQKFAESSLRMDSPQAGYALKPAGFIMCGVVLMLNCHIIWNRWIYWHKRIISCNGCFLYDVSYL
jgi:hypothetical protein